MSPSRRISLALCQAFLVCACALGAVGVAPAFAGPTVYVRILGEASTLLPRTEVTLNQPEPVSGCPADSAAAAINLAVNGNWDHGETNGSAGDFTETILGQTEAFTNESATWGEWVNYRWGGGICTDLLSEGEEVLMIANHEPPPTYGPTVLPLVITAAPTAVQAGVPFTVTVSAGTYSETSDGAEPLPAEGVTVTADGATATTGSNGVATLTLSSTHPATLEATKAGDAPAVPVAICVYSGAENTCVKQSTIKTGSGSSGVGGASGGGSSAQALTASLIGLTEGHIYGPRQAPRLLRGSVIAGGILGKVRLRLTRRWRTRSGRVHCSFYSGVTDAFKGMRCGAGHGHFFSVGSNSNFSYLLPSALAPGRYVLDLEATNGSGEHTKLARGSTRLVFYVR